MAVYNMSKIKEWYENFNSCKSSYLNNYYQSYKSSYIVTNNDSSISRMQKKLDGYYSKLKNAYSKVGSTWKNLYNDLINADAALAGQKSSGSVNASGASAKISAMPKLVEYKNDLGLTGTVTSMDDVNVATANVASNLNISDDVSNATNNVELANEMINTAAVCATIGTIMAPGVGTVLGGVAGAILSKTGAVSKIKDWFVGVGKTIKETAASVKNEISSIKEEVEDTDGALNKLKVVGSGAKDIGKKLAATGATIAISTVEGLAKLVEDVFDLVALVGTVVASVGTGVVDLANLAGAKITGDDSYKSDYTKRMWEKARSFVATNHVGNVFDMFYDNTSAGQWIKENAFAFDTTRAITREISEVLGVIAITILTAGVGGAVAGTATSVGAGVSAAAASTAVTTTGAAITYGAVKTAEHTETNWQDENTSTGKGFLKGILQGTADGVFFALGAKGDSALKGVAEGTAKTALKDAGITVAKDASKKVLQESLKGLSKESAKVLSKDLSKILAKKTAFECGTAVAQDLGTIGIDTIFTNNTVTDENGSVIKLNGLKDKWNYNYNKAGGAKGLAQSAITAGILSGLSDRVDTTGLLKGAKQVQRQANKTAVKSAFSAAGGKAFDSLSKVKNKIDSSAVKQKITDSMSSTKSKLHSTNLKMSYKLDQLKASANLKLVNGGLIVAEKAIGLKNAIKSFSGDTISKVKNKLDNSAIKKKVTDSALNTKSKLHSTNLKTSYKLDQLKASTNLKLTKAKISTASKVVDLGLAIKNLTGDTISKVKNKIDTSTVKQKITDSISNTKSKLSTTKKVVGGISSNIAEYSKTKLKNVNLKFKNSLSNTKFKLDSGVTTLSGAAISLKNKLKASVDDTINKINVKKQAKQDAKLGVKNIDDEIRKAASNELDDIKIAPAKLREFGSTSIIKRSDGSYLTIEYKTKKMLNGKELYIYNIDGQNVYLDMNIIEKFKNGDVRIKNYLANTFLDEDRIAKHIMTNDGYLGKIYYEDGSYKKLRILDRNKSIIESANDFEKYLDGIRKNKNSDYGVDQNVLKSLSRNKKLIKGTIDDLQNRYNISEKNLRVVLNNLNKAGACSYADRANAIFNSYMGMENQFLKDFGYPMYKNIKEKTYLNSNTLIADLYINSNLPVNGGKLFRFDAKTGEIILHNKFLSADRNFIGDNQIYMSGANYLNDDAINRFFISHNINNKIESSVIKSNGISLTETHIQQIKNELIEGNQVHMGLRFDPTNPQPIKMKNLDGGEDMITSQWQEALDSTESSGHAVFVTGINDNGVIVSSWGDKYFIDFSELKNLNSSFFVSKITKGGN